MVEQYIQISFFFSFFLLSIRAQEEKRHEWKYTFVPNEIFLFLCYSTLLVTAGSAGVNPSFQ
jgi:hypothetical protein